MFITNSPLINVLNAKLSLFSSTSSHYLALKKKKEQIAAELHSILEETLDWAENLKFDLSSQDVFSQR
ncbi:hypothetical protein HMI55_003477 [Coelomomyces lativittatus]|nr:hypothetical protein HMI55_003477 [Coelomomyces lativittatus]